MSRLALLPLLLLMLALPRAAGATSTATDCVEVKEAAVAELINDIRAEHGLSRLYLSDTLSASSEHFVQQMGHHDWFAHYAPDGTSWADNQRNHGYDENTWRGQIIGAVRSTPEGIVDAWMNSDSHRAVILDPSAVVMGVGHTYYADSSYSHYWTIDFGGFRDAAADFC
jgi:uncharacterized protein YkwD